MKHHDDLPLQIETIIRLRDHDKGAVIVRLVSSSKFVKQVPDSMTTIREQFKARAGYYAHGKQTVYAHPQKNTECERPMLAAAVAAVP
jgi:hypothetical protein